ncbi:glycoside hydrolase family 78 protein [Xylariaceae sp. FL0016]|nr:glycoside hydrolase family 78 protein [Xylariaceae sp. FL0016]
MLTRALISLVLWPAVPILGPDLRALARKDDPPSWHQYVHFPASGVFQAYVLSQPTEGNITAPGGAFTGAVLSRAVDSLENSSVVLDFGRNVVGLLELEFGGSANGSDGGWPGLRLVFSETLEFLGNRSDYTRSDNAGQAEGDPPKITPGTDQIAVKNAPYTWINQWGCEYGNQVCSDGLHGFRYVRIEMGALDSDAPYTSPYGQVHLKSAAVRWSGYQGTPDTYTGFFECSDAALTQYWFDGAYTVEMGTDVFQTNDTEPRGAASASLVDRLVLHDGAKRDRDPYVGDLAVSALTSYLTHDDAQEAARNVLEDLALHQRSDGWIPPASIQGYTLPLFDYPLWWVSSSWDHVMYTGNVSYIETYYPVLVRVLDGYYPANTDIATALLVRPAGYGDYAFLPRDGSAAYYSALYVRALSRAAGLADVLTRPGDASRWRARADGVRRGFVAELWDPSAGAFLDRRCGGGGGTGCEAHAQDGNALAVLSGIANATLAASVLRYLGNATARPYGNAFYDGVGEALGEGFADRVYPFISYFEIAARFETGDAEGALELVHRTWGWMGGRDPGGTSWEGIGTDGAPYEGAFTSMAHGWSTGATPLLTSYVLGVQPVKPGFKEWVVKPLAVGNRSGITWARGTVPTAYGPFNVDWEVPQNGGNITINLTAPEGTNGTVIVEGDEGGNTGLLKATGLERQGVVKDGFVEFTLDGGREHSISYPS